jgi:hypothetical protein
MRTHTPPLAPAGAGRRLTVAAALALAAGCGTTRMTDTQRTATEQLLISNAIDQSVAQLDVRALASRPVFLDVQYLDGAVDRGYLVSSLRQHLLANGCLLQEERAKATYVVEARAGGVGTDRHSLLVGIPQTTVPALVPGQPTQIPEIPIAKKTDQNGVAKIAVFAYNRKTGQPVWQSGMVQSLSTSRDVWVLGTGPFQNGTIRKGTEFAGEPLPLPHFPAREAAAPQPALVPLTKAAQWPDRAVAGSDGGPKAGSETLLPGVADALGALARALAPGPDDGPRKGRAGDGDTPVSAAAAKPAKPAAPANAGGGAETQPRQVLTSGLGMNPL